MRPGARSAQPGVPTEPGGRAQDGAALGSAVRCAAKGWGERRVWCGAGGAGPAVWGRRCGARGRSPGPASPLLAARGARRRGLGVDSGAGPAGPRSAQPAAALNLGARCGRPTSVRPSQRSRAPAGANRAGAARLAQPTGTDRPPTDRLRPLGFVRCLALDSGRARRTSRARRPSPASGLPVSCPPSPAPRARAHPAARPGRVNYPARTRT